MVRRCSFGRLAESLFLRFYATNLARNSRNDPRVACGDAVCQLGALGGIVSTTVYMATGVVLAPALLRHMDAVDWTYLVISAGAGGAIGLWGWFKFRGYKDDLEAAAP